MPSDPFYHTPQWRALRTACLKRDHYRCTVPGCTDRATTVDHIKRRRDGGADALHNLRSLCSTHDNQVKEQANGQRRNGGKFKIIGSTEEGWPLTKL